MALLEGDALVQKLQQKYLKKYSIHTVKREVRYRITKNFFNKKTYEFRGF